MAASASASLGNQVLSSVVELYLSAKNLPNMDTFSKSDPFVVVYVQSTITNNTAPKWTEYGRTEVIQDNLNPVWAHQTKIEYHFELVQKLRFEVYDEDKKNSKKLTDHDFIGSCEVTLSSIMGARGQAKQIKLQNNKMRSAGEIIIRGEEMKACSEFLKMRLTAKNLAKGMFEKLQPIFSIWRMREDGSKQKIFESPHVPYTNKTAYSPEFDISVQAVCNADYERPIFLRCSTFRKNKEPRDIGEVQTSLQKLMESVNVPMNILPVAATHKKGKKKATGQIILSKCDLTRKPTFLEYIRGGCELNLLVAIDFTASNGAPSTASSLHYRDPHRPNEYQTAIQAVGAILEEYDSDNMYPVYGFGGQINNKTDHCFPLNFDPHNPEVHGVQGILQAYANSFSCVSLSGPTIFSKVLQMAIANTRALHNSQESQSYNVLLILTDGIINDMQDTIDNIVQASDMGLSIIIVGVGNADFSSMETLDADDEPLRSRNGRYMKRDIVQFVPFRQFRANPSVLAREVLEEIPGQLLSFMASKGIKPNPALTMAVPVSPGPATAVLPPTAPAEAAAVASVGAIPTAQVAGAVPVAAHTASGGFGVAGTAPISGAPTANTNANAGMSEEAALAAAMAASMQVSSAPPPMPQVTRTPSAAARWGSAINKVKAINRFAYGAQQSVVQQPAQPYLPTPPPAPAPAPSAGARWGSAIAKVQAANRFRQQMQVVCPAGVYPGQAIQISLPSGELRQVVVPAGVMPGGAFNVLV